MNPLNFAILFIKQPRQMEKTPCNIWIEDTNTIPKFW